MAKHARPTGKAMANAKTDEPVDLEAGSPAGLLTWEGLRDLDKPSHWHIGDGPEMLKRAASRNHVDWGRADQMLPDL